MPQDAKVFIVDDDAAMRDSLTWLLGAAGFTVDTFADAETFLRRVSPQQAGCLLLDVRMPGLGGMGLLELLPRRGYRLPVIILTGYADVPLAVRALKAGAMEFVEKPINDQELAGIVRNALARDAEDRRVRQDEVSARSRLRSLTKREREVVGWLAKGESNKAIARRLDVSVRTVEVHRANSMKKLKVHSLGELLYTVRSRGADRPGPGGNGGRGAA